jgi:hypothetical protein
MLRTAAVALAVLAAIGCVSLLVQTRALGRPTTARLELVHTLQALTEYRRSNAAIRVGADRYVTRCHHLAVWANRRLLAEIHGRLLHPRGIDGTLFELAGCPRGLARRLSADLLGGTPFKIRFRNADGIRAWALRLPGTRPALELFVSPRTGLPVELMLQAGAMRGTSDVVYVGQR